MEEVKFLEELHLNLQRSLRVVVDSLEHHLLLLVFHYHLVEEVYLESYHLQEAACSELPVK